MFEHETENIIDAARERVFRNFADAVAVKDILASDVPHPIKTFFRADVEAMLFAEQQNYRRTSRFHLDHPEVRSLQQQINSILILNYTFKRTEFQQRLHDAVHMIINYLVRPQWTLSSVVFEKQEAVSSSDLLGFLRYFGAYEYLKEIIAAYIREKHVGSITRKEFESLVWKADGEFIRRKAGDELARIMSPLFDFFDFPRNTGNNSLPIKAMIKFFEDKGLPAVISQLDGETAQGKTGLNRHELGELLEAVRRNTGAFQVEKLETERKDLVSTIATAPVQPSEPSPIPTTTSAAFDFATLFNENDRRRLIKKIFKQDDEAFRTTLQNLSQLTTWREASRFIDEMFISRDVDPYTVEAERFIEVVFQHFYPSGKR